MKNGLIYENDEWIYYKNDKPYHAGAIEENGTVYYIGSDGRAVKGQHIVHSEMTNGILKRGTYTFDENCKLIKNSYVPPRKRRKRRLPLTSKVPGRKKRRKKKQLTKKQKRKVLASVLMLCVLFVTAVTIDGLHGSKTQTISERTQKRVVLPTFDEDVLLCSNAAKLAYDGQIELKDAVTTGDPYCPFIFEYHFREASGVLLLGEKEDLSDSKEYILEEEADYEAIDNLKVDTTYYYEVRVGKKVYPGSFHTALAPRFVSIPGLTNTRDIGGGVTQDGKKIKQGLLIRGVELDGLVNAPYYIPEEELDGVQETFGFKFDMDLREEHLYSGQYTSRLNVEHKFYTAPQYGQIFSTSYRNSLKHIFSDLADEEKYPMYLHCTWGKDRTGTVVFLLQGILNVSEEDMIREYRLSGYTDKSLAESRTMDPIINGLKPYDGDTLQEKIVSFLKEEIGVTDKEIESIRAILLEP